MPEQFRPSRRCKDCRFWSDKVAKSTGDNPEVEALCLNNQSPDSGRYKYKSGWCWFFRRNTHGTVDESKRAWTHYKLTEGPEGVGQDPSSP